MTIHTLISPFADRTAPPLKQGKYIDPLRTADGSARAAVAFSGLKTLWFNTGTLCNIACANCYIESSPRNDALAYLTRADVEAYLNEIAEQGLPTSQVGVTGGEPFMNSEILDILRTCLSRGFETLVLTNAMKPMRRFGARLLVLNDQFGDQLKVRVSLDHHRPAAHDAERGDGAWRTAVDGLRWLSDAGFSLAVAGRHLASEHEDQARAAYGALFKAEQLRIDAADPQALVLFPEMQAQADVPEITEACWGILGRHPSEMMCATSRMVIKRRGAEAPVVVACTLTPYAPEFELGPTLTSAERAVHLNHPHCAQFCVLGGSSCGGG